MLRVSVRRQVACYVTERRTGGNTTDKFYSHTAYAVNLQNAVVCPQYSLIYTSRWTSLLYFTCVVEYTLIAPCLTFLTYILFSLYSRKFRKYPYLETLHHTYAILGNYITFSNCKQLNILQCSRILHYA